MTIMSRAWASLKYHRHFLHRYLLLLAIFLPPILFMNTLRSGIQQSSETLQLIFKQDTMPQVDQKWLQSLLSDMRNLVPFYDFSLLICCGLFGVLVFILGCHYCGKRRSELSTYKRLGVSKFRLAAQFLLEFLIPATLALLVLFMLLVIFQATIETLVQNVQSQLLEKYTTASSMTTASVDKAGADYPIAVQLPSNGLLLIQSLPLDNNRWFVVTLQAILATAGIMLGIFIAALPLAMFIVTKRRSFK